MAEGTLSLERGRSRRAAWDAEFSAFFDAEFPHVFRAAYLFCGDRESARDAAQEAFVRAYERWGRLRQTQWLTGWTMTTAFNLCRRQAARAYREVATDSLPERVGPAGGKGEVMDVVRAIRSLPIRQRQAVTLFYLTDYSSAEIAQVLGISEGAVKKHLARARAALRFAPEIGEMPNG